MMNIGGQRPKIGGNWPLISPYLQRCRHALRALKKMSNTDFEERFGPWMWFFSFKWYTTFENLEKPHGYEKSSSWVVIKIL